MEADSTGDETTSHVQDCKVESSQVSSCDEEVVIVSITCNKEVKLCGENDEDKGTDSDKHANCVDDPNFLKHLNVETIKIENPQIYNETNLTEKELEHIEESVLKKYTGLNMDLASENQLLKEDVIKCRCELEKYGKKLAMLERKLDKANSYNDDLRVQIDKLSREVHQYRTDKHKVFTNADTQTSAEDIMEIEDDTLYDVNLPGQKPDGDMTFDWKPDQSTEDVTSDSFAAGDMSIADSLKATAEAAMNQTGFVFDEQSGLYYDYTTGYYYNAEKGLYYDPKSGTYFYFNKSTGKYEFHSQVDLSYYTPTSHLYPDRSQGFHHHSSSSRYTSRSPDHYETLSGKKKKKKESRRRSSDDRVDAGYEEVLSAFSSLSVRPESTLRNAPCIRAMVTLSDVLEEGTLFIVTIEGGFIGREKKEGLAICVPDLNVSKVHAEIRYNKKEQNYSIQDKGSQNGTFVNEERLSESKNVSKWVTVKHKDVLQLNCTRFELHIHHGNETCDQCEPGQVMNVKEPEKVISASTKDKKASHKAQLKNIKKKYGLVSSSYTDNSTAINNPAYQDKAKERRKTVGSDNPHQPDSLPSSVHRPIKEDNKGHKLLKKMGWTEGESLGKDNIGIQEPINVNMRVDSSAGLGAFGGANEMSIGNIGVVSARRRYLQTQLRISSSVDHKNKQFEPKLWVQGSTQDNIDLINLNENENKTK